MPNALDSSTRSARLAAMGRASSTRSHPPRFSARASIAGPEDKCTPCRARAGPSRRARAAHAPDQRNAHRRATCQRGRERRGVDTVFGSASRSARPGIAYISAGRLPTSREHSVAALPPPAEARVGARAAAGRAPRRTVGRVRRVVLARVLRLGGVLLRRWGPASVGAAAAVARLACAARDGRYIARGTSDGRRRQPSCLCARVGASTANAIRRAGQSRITHEKIWPRSLRGPACRYAAMYIADRGVRAAAGGSSASNPQRQPTTNAEMSPLVVAARRRSQVAAAQNGCPGAARSRGSTKRSTLGRGGLTRRRSTRTPAPRSTISGRP